MPKKKKKKYGVKSYFVYIPVVYKGLNEPERVNFSDFPICQSAPAASTVCYVYKTNTDRAHVQQIFDRFRVAHFLYAIENSCDPQRTVAVTIITTTITKNRNNYCSALNIV